MSSKTETTWTCDRCGAAIVTAPDARPSMWITVGGTRWLHNDEVRQFDGRERHLCNPCDCLLTAFFRNVPVWDAFTLAASAYFEKPRGAAGNAALYEAARTAYLEWLGADGEIDPRDACGATLQGDQDEMFGPAFPCTRPIAHEGLHGHAGDFTWSDEDCAAP